MRDGRALSAEPQFKPWRVDWQCGLVLLLVASCGVAVAIYADAHQVQVFGGVLGVLSGCAGLAYLRRGFTRARGKAVEVRALARLQKLLQPGWELQCSVPLSRGDLDGLLLGPSGERFGLEIKSQTAIHLRKGGLLTQARLEDGRGEAMGEVYLRQARNNARELGAKPVLWFPAAKQQQMLKDLEGCLVVCGNSKYLSACIRKAM